MHLLYSLTTGSLLKMFSLLLVNSIQWKPNSQKSAIPVIDPAISVLNKHLTIPIKHALSFKHSADLKFETLLLKGLFNLVGPALQPALAISVCQSAANWAGTTNTTLYFRIVLLHNSSCILYLSV